MRNFKIIVQQTFYNGNSIVDKANDVIETEITSETLIINEGESYDKILIFDSKDIDVTTLDPLYKLKEFINGEWVIIDQHECNSKNCN